MIVPSTHPDSSSAFDIPNSMRCANQPQAKLPLPSAAIQTLHDKNTFHLTLKIACILALTAGAFFVRLDHISTNSLSEDEVAKWQAVEQYRAHHFAGVNGEHPMVMKTLAWASVTIGEHWSRLTACGNCRSMRPEGWLRLPNVVLGAATTIVIYLLCHRLIGEAGAFAASFFWAFAPLPIALNRLLKEETPVTFFSLLACYFYCRAKQATKSGATQHWLDLSAAGFGLAFASQYLLHIFGFNALTWHIAGRRGLDHKPVWSQFGRFFVILCVALVLADPVIISPDNFSYALHWMHGDNTLHTGYNLNGSLYLNLPLHAPHGMPWYFYLWLLFVKTPIPILTAMILGGIFLLKERHTLASCFFLSLGLGQLVGLSLFKAKWIRYSLPMLPFLFLAAGYGVQRIYELLARSRWRPLLLVVAFLVFVAWPLMELRSWAPWYSFYLNAFGGGRNNAARYFGPDETSEFDSREVAQIACSTAPQNSRLATARPMSMSWYVNRCSRQDIQVLPLYDPRYVPSAGDMIDLEHSREFFETQRYFNLLEHSNFAHTSIQAGPVVSSTIYYIPTLQQASNMQLDSSEVARLKTSKVTSKAQTRGQHVPINGSKGRQ